MLADFAGQQLHAVAGIGNPELFFATLRAAGLDVIPHAYGDHHHFRGADLQFGDGSPVLLTEKDAVKCLAFAGPEHWVVPVAAQIDEAGTALVRKLTDTLKKSARNP